MKITPRTGKAAFTLIEVMAVITIIVILAGLVVGGMGFVSERQAKEKAKVQMALLSKALEEYKLDMGTYPPTADLAVTGALTTSKSYNSGTLFKALFWDSDNDSAGVPVDLDQRIYLADLDPVTSKQGWTTAPASDKTKILDPWGNEYMYRTATGIPNATTGVAAANNSTQNPDFDLWSAGKNGKTNPDPKVADSLDDIRNF